MKVGNQERLESATSVRETFWFGGGVPSSALLLMVLWGEIDFPGEVVFADTEAETQRAYNWIGQIERFCHLADTPFHRVSAGNLAKVALNEKQREDLAILPLHISQHGRPVVVQRQCTQRFKIEVIQQFQRDALGLKARQRVPKGTHFLNWIALPADEANRIHEPRHVKWATNFYPLIERGITRSDCQKWLNDHGYTVPQCVCKMCPLKSDHDWGEMQKKDSNDWKEAVQFGRLILNVLPLSEAYLHPSLQPIEQVRTWQNPAFKVGFKDWQNENHGVCNL